MPTFVPGSWYKKLVAYLWYDFALIIWVGMISLISDIKSGRPVINLKDSKKRSENVAIITGGPRGIALGLLKRLLHLDYKVVMGVRNIEDGKCRLRQFYEANDHLPTNNVNFFEMDLKSLKSVRMFAENVLENYERVDLLLCNAATMREPYVLTEDGFESQFQVNYLSHFLLTQLLLDRIKETGRVKGSSCHIIYTSSIGSEVGKFHFSELGKPTLYTPFKFYYTSKLCQVSSVLSLAEKMRNEKSQIYIYACHPGTIPTDMWFTGGNYLVGLIGKLFSPLLWTIENGADAILFPVFSSNYQNEGGLYMASGTIREPSREARNKENQAFLYEKSMEFIHEHLKQ